MKVSAMPPLFHFLQISSICGNVTVARGVMQMCVINVSDMSEFVVIVCYVFFIVGSLAAWLCTIRADKIQTTINTI